MADLSPEESAGGPVPRVKRPLRNVIRLHDVPTTHRIVHGDSRLLELVPDDQVQLVVTSPPYWQLKDYGDERQIGFHETYEGYLASLQQVWTECFRTLSPGCRMCINVGDQFARSVVYGRYKVIPIQAQIIRDCEGLSFDYMGSIIWQKVTTTNTTGGASIMGSYPYPRNGIVKIDYEHILLFKKPGKAPRPSSEHKHASKLTIAEWNEFFSGHWNVPGVRQDAHIAAFPEEIPARLIRMFSFCGETVLDPFVGSGTTSAAAARWGRNSIGYEIAVDSVRMTRNRLSMLLAEVELEFHEQSIAPKANVEAHRSESIPHIEPQLDPRSLDFGSRISAS